METGGSSKKSKSKGKGNVDYDSSRFTGMVKEKLYNRIWVSNGAVIERELKANIKYNPVTEKGKKRLTSWVRGKKLKVTPDIFVEIFQILREENPEFELPNIGMPDLDTISHELLLEGEEWDGERTVSISVTKASLLWVIGMEKTIDLPCMMFISLCAARTASDTRGYVPFMGFLMKLFKRSGVHIPIDLIRIEPERTIDKSSLSRSEGQRKKRRLEAIIHEEPSIGMAELKDEIMNLRMEMNTCMTASEEESSRHMTMLQ
ncbi:hypothetical protein Acr_04g0000510 [Actinidia rufa]|uniref:Uncharacterized protein n=1 Tax=Actinidia rufa TaxID=165716 RepID=A0A7J0EFT1_9ERIC|nr:hypothetical protein Acr_04g0000510 [Actinidia rufa]